MDERVIVADLGELRAIYARVAMYASLAGVLVCLPYIIIGQNLGVVLYIFVGIPILLVALAVAIIVVMVLAIRKRRRRAVQTLLATVVCGACIWVTLLCADTVRTTARWLVASPYWKTTVRSSPPSPGSLQHAEWDGSGFAGMDTTVYLVYDPTDQLASPMKVGHGLRAPGLPCDVWKIHRVEHSWYTVQFFTDTEWKSNRCVY